MWNIADVTDDDKQIAQFVGALRKRELMWYINFTENQTRSKANIKANFLALFKIEEVTHLATQKFKDIKHVPSKPVQEYDKRFKDL